MNIEQAVRTIEELIIKRRQSDATNQDIANEIGWSPQATGYVISHLIKKGLIQPRRKGGRRLSDTDQKKREEDIITLRAQNYSNNNIAKTMGLSIGVMNKTTHQLIKKGRIKKRHPGRSGISDTENNERNRLIIECREQGLTMEETVRATDLSKSVVERIIRRLITQGRLKKHPPKRSALHRNPDHLRFKTIVQNVQRHATLKEIGTALDLTKERIRQLIAEMRKEHGDQIFEPHEKVLWTVREAAAEVDATQEMVRILCRTGKIPFLPRGEREWLLDEKGLAALKQHLLITRTRTCEICGAIFVHKKTVGRHRKICYSDECKLEKERRRFNPRILLARPKPESLRGWRGEVLRRLKNHTVDAHEELMLPIAATQHAGISNMQLYWLYYQNILTTRPHPTKKGKTGKPVAQYVKSELDIVRQVYEAYRACGGKR